MIDHIEQPAAEPSRHYVRRSLRPKPPTVRERLRLDSNAAFWAAVAVVGVLVVALLAVSIDLIASSGRVHPGVTLAGIGVGGKHPDDARAELEAKLTERSQKPVLVAAGDDAWEVEPAALGAGYDYDALVDAAMDVGRGEHPFTERIRAWFGGVEVPVAASIDATAFAGLSEQIKQDVAVAPTDAAVVVNGTDVRVEPSATGVRVVEEELARRLSRAVASEDRRVEVPTEVAQPLISDEAAEAAAAEARGMLEQGVVLKYKEDSWSFEPAQIAPWIGFRTIDPTEEQASASLQARVSARRLTEALEPKIGDLGRPAKNARFRARGGEVTIEPSQDGLAPDFEGLADTLTDALKTADGERTAELRMTLRKPEITTEKARSMGIKERISTYTTTFSSGATSRVNNIHKLADALDGTLVEPGGSFSFNGTVGERTAAKGYEEAPAIINGELVPQLGGGICQVNTTLFNSVFNAGLPVTERHNHSFYISHYPKGRDATVSWGGPDFKFRNDTDSWILIATGYSSSSVTISIYGTDPGYEVISETGSWYNVREQGTEQIKDPELQKGAKVVEASGQSGRSIKVTRIVKKNGTVIREDTFTSNYRPVARKVRVGTKEPSKESTATPAPTTP